MGRRHHHAHRPTTVGQALFLLVIGLLLGTVFLVEARYGNRAVQPDDARHLTARYESYEIARSDRLAVRANRRRLLVRFSGELCFDIPQVLNSDALESNMAALSPETEVALIVHPHSDIILDMRTEELVLLSFDESAAKLTWHRHGYLLLALLGYAMASLGASSLILRGVKARKRRRPSHG